ncbi:MAG: NAD(P)-dependent oxidoreductase [Rhabdochlamydiaceae bacterium]|nr:NAD(P)-dependent oxidoreductase [Rhabdochlamydiaceae bacterium]
MKILITGSKGLIGSSLARSLANIGIEVLGLDLKYDQEDPNFGDILDGDDVFSKVSQVDGIVHLAAVSRVIDGEKKPQLCWKTNVEGTENIVQASAQSEKEPWIIYASSREVYGEQKELPVKESTPLKPVNIYGESKFAAEKKIEEAQQRGLVATIVRFSNVYGSIHDHPDRVIPAFCRASALGTTIRVDGRENSFDFTYLDDVVQGLISLILLISARKTSFYPIHFTRGIGVTLEQVAAIAQRASEFPISIVEGPSRSFDVSCFYGDPSRAKELLGWDACVSIEEGMIRLIHQFRLHFLSELQGAHVVL